MTRPLLLDLFCCQGGAAVGYHRAGFDVIGVDVKPQPRYPFAFEQADALDYLREEIEFAGRKVSAVHASPPCQKFSVMRSLHNAREHPDLIGPTRELLDELGVPYVMENVPGAPLRSPAVLCGSMFGLKSEGDRYLRRHRHFETNWPFAVSLKCDHRGKAVGVYGHGQAGLRDQRMRTAKAPEARILMGMEWATRDGMSQAIPPAYTEYIGRQLLAHLEQLKAVA